jgi:Protein of unknown function (DUF2815)
MATKAVFSPIGTFSFPNLFVPRAASPGAEERFSVALIFDAAAQATPEYRAMKKAAYDAAVAKWGAKADTMLRSGQIRMPFRDAGEKAQWAGYRAGDVFISAWSKQKPDVLDGRLNDVVPSDLYPGCRGRITYTAFAYESSGNRGVSIGLNNVQVVDFKAPRLDGKRDGRDEFDAVDMGDDDDRTPVGAGAGADDADNLPF